MIKLIANHRIAAIDPKGELTAEEKKDVLIVFADHYMKIPLKIGIARNSDTNAECQYLFGTE